MPRSLQILLGSIFLLAGNAVAAEDATSNRINGVAEFLLDRANDNFLYVLQQDMEANRLLRCYLPETYKAATSNNLRLLLQSGHEVWRASVETDLKNLGVQLIFKELSSDALKKWAERVDEEYIKVLQNVRIRVGSELHPVDRLPVGASPELKTAINSFYDDYLLAQAKIRIIIADVKKAESAGRVTDFANCPATAYGSISAVLLGLEQTLNSLKAQTEYFKNADIVWNKDISVSPGSAFYSALMGLVVVEDRLADYSKRIELIRRERSLVVQMSQLDQLIRESIRRGENPLVSSSDMPQYERFSHYAISFAALSEAQSTAQAKSVMQQLTLPSVSFGAKREPGASRLMITAYFGVQGGAEPTGSASGEGFAGLTVPVGLEYSYGLNDGSISVMLAPFDFAHPVNKIINDSETPAELKDVVNPGIYLSYGLKKLPLVVGAGYSRGPSISDDQDDNVGRYLVFVALDMPLLALY